MEYLTLSWLDYTFFALLFGISTLIGAYYGWCAKQNQTTSEYLLGGRKMKVFPVSVSLVASTLSGISLLSSPAETYMHGVQYMITAVSPVVLYLVLNYIYLPIYWKLQLTTIFHYLEIRFDRRLRTMASFLSTLNIFFYLPIVIYAPSLAFNQATGFDLYTTAVIMCSVCIFYTALGGLKAVVWSDTLQFCFTLCTLGCVLIMGTISVGGMSVIWERANFGERLDLFNLDADPTIKNSFWSVSIGMTILLVSITAVHPGVTQRFFAVSTLEKSKNALKIFTLFNIITKLICCCLGLITYAKYYSCDPFTTRQVKKPDQILPFFVMDLAKQLPGIGGVFIAGLFSTALSTLSTFLNALSGILYEDFISPFLPLNASDKNANNYMKMIAAVLGVITVGMVFVIQRLGTVVELASSLNGSILGPLLGIFTLGAMFPIANKKGAFAGSLISMFIMLTISINYQVNVWHGNIKQKPKPLYTHGCNMSYLGFNVANESYSSITNITSTYKAKEIHWFLKISVHYYAAIGLLLTIIIGLFVSFLTKNECEPINPDTLWPYVQRFVPKSASTAHYASVQKEMDAFCEGDCKNINELHTSTNFVNGSVSSKSHFR